MIVTRNFDQKVKKEVPNTKYDCDIMISIYDIIFHILLDVGPSQ